MESNILKGLVYGNIIGSPFIGQNAESRYFDMGETVTVYDGRRLRRYEPAPTGAAYGCAAVSRWLIGEGPSPTLKGLRNRLYDAYRANPGVKWDSETVSSLASGEQLSQTADWGPVVRSVVIGGYLRDGMDPMDNNQLIRDIAALSVDATCSNSEVRECVRVIVDAIWSLGRGASVDELRSRVEHGYDININMPTEELKARLLGQKKEAVEMLGNRVEVFRSPAGPPKVEAEAVTVAALRALLRSDSWEDAVRTAVALGGPSDVVGALAGALATAAYGDVPMNVERKVYSYVPEDLSKEIEAYGRKAFNRDFAEKVEKQAERLPSVSALYSNTLSGERLLYVVEPGDEQLKARMSLLHEKGLGIPLGFISKEQFDTLLGFPDDQSQTHVLQAVYEPVTLFISKGSLTRGAISPKALDAWEQIRTHCIRVQQDLNTRAGNRGMGQVRYENARHIIIGQNSIRFYCGALLCDTLTFDGKCIRREFGEFREIGADIPPEQYRELEWERRGVFPRWIDFSRADSIVAMKACEAIGEYVLDEGTGYLENQRAVDRDYRSGEDEMQDFRILTNAERLDKVPEDSAPLLPSSIGWWSKDTGMEVQRKKEVFTFGLGSAVHDMDRHYKSGKTDVLDADAVNRMRICGIETVIDTRRRADDDALSKVFEENGITYYFAGDSLGGWDFRIPAKGEGGTEYFNSLRDSESYKASIEAIGKMVEAGKRVCILDSVQRPQACRHFFLASRTLEKAGYSVCHITTEGNIIRHSEAETALVVRDGLYQKSQASDPRSYAKQLEEAYSSLEWKHRNAVLNKRKFHRY